MNFRDDAMIKLRQTTEAHKIKELLCKLSDDLKLPEIYQPGDFHIVDGFIEPFEEFSDIKIVINNRYAVSPIIIKKKAVGKKKIDTRGWFVEELINIPASSEQPEEMDSRVLGKVSNLWDVVKVILINDVQTIVENALYSISESETDAAAFTAVELFKNAS